MFYSLKIPNIVKILVFSNFSETRREGFFIERMLELFFKRCSLPRNWDRRDNNY